MKSVSFTFPLLVSWDWTFTRSSLKSKPDSHDSYSDSPVTGAVQPVRPRAVIISKSAALNPKTAAFFSKDDDSSTQFSRQAGKKNNRSVVKT